MKKTIFLNYLLIAAGFAVYAFIVNIFLPGWLIWLAFLSVTILAGAVTAIAQRKSRSYEYLPGVLAGAAAYSILVIFFIKLHFYSGSDSELSLLSQFNPFRDKDQIFGHLALVFLYVVGGLIGIAVRGAGMVFWPQYKFDFYSLSRRTYVILAIASSAVFAGSIFLTAGLDKDMWVCENNEWVKDGEPEYDKPDVACIDGSPDFWNDGQSGLEIAYPQGWRGKIDITHKEEENWRTVRFDYKNPQGEKALLFSASIIPTSFGLERVYSLSDQRPVLKSDSHIIAVAEGSWPTESGTYASLFEDVDEVIENMRLRDGQGERIVGDPDVRWKYQDDRYGFSFDYPSNLRLRVKDNDIVRYGEAYGGGEKMIDRSVNLSVPYSGPGIINISVIKDPGVRTTAEWLESENERLRKMARGGHFVRYTIEKEMKIDNEKAILVFEESDTEKYEHEKKAVFLKDGMLIEIYTRGKDEKLWHSFKFD